MLGYGCLLPPPQLPDRHRNKSVRSKEAEFVEKGTDENTIVSDNNHTCLMAKILKYDYPARASFWIVDSCRTWNLTFDQSLFVFVS